MAEIGVIGVQIPANQALSGEIDLGAFNLVAIEMPEGWAGSTITFQSKANRQEQGSGVPVEDWDDVYDSAGNELQVTVAANRVVVDIPELASLRFIRIRSGTSAAPFNQNPTREIKLICKH